MKNTPTAKEIEMKRKTVGGDEVDAFAKTRRSRNWKAGERKALKAKASRRERRDARIALAR
ncbi:hypothetical protein CHR55_32165 [Rhodococcus qingshengii]|uniref:Uncharacterized protein n=1 Tax=Rhodococcus qingshengii TaxID=334542 RepID=A0A2A5IZ31_RHOSG|nr:hypothetical protein ABM90_03725 [Rhodococcus erythropolis]KSU61692.1 hypothetical protein AS032_34125 [Rhodococcus qingshengii]PCK22513.1 hypothetical protein CHR55_32165 [Rhodococcus qingshengii]